MCCKKDLFHNRRVLNDKCHNIIVPDGRKVKVQHMGDILLPNGLCLKDVLYVPYFHFNLISVHKLVTQLKCSINFYANTCFIQEQLKKHLLLGSKF